MPIARATHVRSHEPSPRRRGLTLVELLMSVILIAIVGLAVATLSGATAAGWRVAGEQAQAGLAATENRMHATFSREINQALAVGYCDGIDVPSAVTGKSYLVLWAGDELSGVNGDATAQFGELRIFEISSPDSQLSVWIARPFATLDGTEQAFVVTDVADEFNRVESATRALSSGAFSRHRVIGGADDSVRVMGGGFAINRIGGSIPYATVRYALKTNKNGSEMTTESLVVRRKSDLPVTP